MKTTIGLSNDQRKGVCVMLGKLLADEYLLLVKTKNYHWNVQGMNFGPLHKFFDEQYEALNEVVDEVAERIRSLGEMTPATLAEFIKLARIKEAATAFMEDKKMLQNLLADHESIIRYLRVDLETCDKKYHDIGTNDFLTGLMEKHEKMAWMLRSFLGK